MPIYDTIGVFRVHRNTQRFIPCLQKVAEFQHFRGVRTTIQNCLNCACRWQARGTRKGCR